jgi:hypothetical protein
LRKQAVPAWQDLSIKDYSDASPMRNQAVSAWQDLSIKACGDSKPYA